MSLFTKVDPIRATAALVKSSDAHKYVSNVIAEHRKTNPGKISFTETPDGRGVWIAIKFHALRFEIDSEFETAVKARMTDIEAKVK